MIDTESNYEENYYIYLACDVLSFLEKFLNLTLPFFLNNRKD